MMEILKAVLKDSDATDSKERMKVVADTFLRCRQMGHAEAVYKLIPSLTLSMSNVTCKFVATGPKAERSERWQKATEEQMKSNINVVQLANHDGYWFQAPDL